MAELTSRGSLYVPRTSFQRLKTNGSTAKAKPTMTSTGTGTNGRPSFARDSFVDSDRVYVSPFKIAEGVQTDESEIRKFKELVESYEELQKELQSTKRYVESNYNQRISATVRKLYENMLTKLQTMESAYKEDVERVRQACRTELSDAIAQLSGEYEAYHAEILEDYETKLKAAEFGYQEEVIKMKKLSWTRDAEVNFLKTHFSRALQLLQMNNILDPEGILSVDTGKLAKMNILEERETRIRKLEKETTDLKNLVSNLKSQLEKWENMEFVPRSQRVKGLPHGSKPSTASSNGRASEKGVRFAGDEENRGGDKLEETDEGANQQASSDDDISGDGNQLENSDVEEATIPDHRDEMIETLNEEIAQLKLEMETLKLEQEEKLAHTKEEYEEKIQFLDARWTKKETEYEQRFQAVRNVNNRQCIEQILDRQLNFVEYASLIFGPRKKKGGKAKAADSNAKTASNNGLVVGSRNQALAMAQPSVSVEGGVAGGSS